MYKRNSRCFQIFNGSLVRRSCDVDYDYIGVNIYPDTHNDDYVKTLKNTVEEKAAGKQMIISSNKCPWKDSEGKPAPKDADKSIYDYLQATIDEKNAGGLIYNDADFVGAWDSFLMKMDKQCLLLRSLLMHREIRLM